MESGTYLTKDCPICGKLAVSKANCITAQCPEGHYSYTEDRGRTTERVGPFMFHYYEKDDKVAEIIENMAKAYGKRK